VEHVSDIAVFCVVVEKGSFTAAAGALALSKGAVSKYVGRLEQRLGARLLNRTTRRLSLTEAGTALYRRASTALAELKEAEQEATDHADRPRGQLRVSAPGFYGYKILAGRLGEFHRRYPDIQMDLSLDNRFVDLVEERFDVAIRISAPRDSALVMRRLADIPIVACASPEYLERHGRPGSPDELRDHACIIYTAMARAHEWTFVRDDGSHYSVSVEGRFRTNDDNLQREAALSGMGIINMPRLFVREEIERGELVELWPDRPARHVTLAVVYPSRRELPAKVRAFVDFMAECCRNE
jgi:DNA-binding transcriptional LysR family regulator